MEIERRIAESGPLKVERRSGDNAGLTIRGYAAVFNSYSNNLGGFREIIQPGAFADVLENDVRALFNHDPNHVLGRTQSGTLRVFQDDTGLGYEVDLPDTQTARDLVVSIERGDVSQSSFAFTVAPGGATWQEDDVVGYTRSISKVSRLYDVSPVTYPAYPDASVAARALEAYQSEMRATNQQSGLAEREQIASDAAKRHRLLRLAELSA